MSKPRSRDEGANLIGVDPPFVDSEHFEYHLDAGSPAEDAGDREPLEGLGDTDYDGILRVVNGVVDTGV